MELKKAQRKTVKLRLNLSGPSGSGKTYSALLMAYGMIGDWSKIAVIDTENGSASLYSHLGDFQTIDFSAPFSPEKYIEAIDVCIKAGMECIIIDSSSHEWSGAGGCIESNEKLAQSKYKGNTWSAWNETTPKHDKFVNKVLQCPVHVITCTRSKMETVMGEDKKVKKLGMKDIQRDGWEYELTVSLNIDRDTHMAIASKDRTEMFEGKEPFVITPETGKMIIKWCETGIDQDAIDKELAEKAERERKELEAKELSGAIEEMRECETTKSAGDCWIKWHKFQKNPDFLKEKEATKVRLTNNQPPVNDPDDKILIQAMTELESGKTSADYTATWNKYQLIQSHELFSKEFNRRLNKLKQTA